MKRCPQCERKLPLSAYSKARSKRQGVQSWCKECMNATKRARYQEDPEVGRSASRRYREKNPDYWKKYKQERPDWYLRKRYGMTLNDYERMLEQQGGLCANRGCGNSPPSDRRFHVDHDHSCCPGTDSCGKCVRGLLCAPCNQALGNARDNAARLHGLAEYLQRTTKSAEMQPAPAADTDRQEFA